MSRYVTIEWDELRYLWRRFKRRITPRVLREAHDYVQCVDRFVVTQRRKRHMAELMAYAEFYPGSLSFTEIMELHIWQAERDIARAFERQIFGSKPMGEQVKGLKVINPADIEPFPWWNTYWLRPDDDDGKP